MSVEVVISGCFDVDSKYKLKCHFFFFLFGLFLSVFFFVLSHFVVNVVGVGRIIAVLRSAAAKYQKRRKDAR